MASGATCTARVYVSDHGKMSGGCCNSTQIVLVAEVNFRAKVVLGAEVIFGDRSGLGDKAHS